MIRVALFVCCAVYAVLAMDDVGMGIVPDAEPVRYAVRFVPRPSDEPVRILPMTLRDTDGNRIKATTSEVYHSLRAKYPSIQTHELFNQDVFDDADPHVVDILVNAWTLVMNQQHVARTGDPDARRQLDEDIALVQRDIYELRKAYADDAAEILADMPQDPEQEVVVDHETREQRWQPKRR